MHYTNKPKKMKTGTTEEDKHEQEHEMEK